MGSTTPQEVGGEDARHVELLAAMSWLVDHERYARLLDQDGLDRPAAPSIFGIAS
jgi:hypothetical protein